MPCRAVFAKKSNEFGGWPGWGVWRSCGLAGGARSRFSTRLRAHFPVRRKNTGNFIEFCPQSRPARDAAL